MTVTRAALGRGALAAALALSTLACAGSPPPRDVFYRLRVAPPPPRAAPLLPGVVEIGRLQASDVLRGRALAIVRADRPDVVRQADYHYWVDAPPVLVQEALLSYLTEGRLADRAVAPEQRDDPAWIVVGRVERFERVVGGDVGAAVALELSLRRRSERRLLVHGRYTAARAAGGSVEASVAALGEALGDAFAAFLADVAAALPE